MIPSINENPLTSAETAGRFYQDAWGPIAALLTGLEG